MKNHKAWLCERNYGEWKQIGFHRGLDQGEATRGSRVERGVVSLGLGRITIIDLIRMRLRKISPRLIVDGVINTHKAGLTQVKTDMLETHFLAGGNVANVVMALIASDKANISLPFETATAIDLAGRCVHQCDGRQYVQFLG